MTTIKNVITDSEYRLLRTFIQIPSFDQPLNEDEWEDVVSEAQFLAADHIQDNDNYAATLDEIAYKLSEYEY